MNSIERGRRKFKYPRKHDEAYNSLWMGQTKESHLASGENAFFVDKKDIFIVSAILGYKNNKKEKFSDGIPFTADFREYAGVIYSIGINETRDAKILDSKEMKGKLETIIEGYACGGFEILQNKLKEKGKSPLEVYENLIEEFESKDELDIFEDIF
jgi:dnd system-associated protein 4